MIWTIDKLVAFKDFFNLTDKQIGDGINETAHMVWKMRNDVISLEKYSSRLTMYMEAVKEGKMREYEKMAEVVKSFI